MRKVLFRKWTSGIDEPCKDGYGKVCKEGTGCWEDGFPNTGIFHQWASSWEGSSDRPGEYTVGLVELPDGSIVEVSPTDLIFVDPMVL